MIYTDSHGFIKYKTRWLPVIYLIWWLLLFKTELPTIYGRTEIYLDSRSMDDNIKITTAVQSFINITSRFKQWRCDNCAVNADNSLVMLVLLSGTSCITTFIVYQKDLLYFALGGTPVHRLPYAFKYIGYYLLWTYRAFLTVITFSANLYINMDRFLNGVFSEVWYSESVPRTRVESSN